MTQQSTRNTVIQPGEPAPLWSAESNAGRIDIADYLGETPILLLFYMADWSSICSAELPMIEELLNLAGGIDLKAFGVSPDSPACHSAFAHQIGLDKITLVTDDQNKIARLYRVVDREGLPKRAAVLIDSNGRVGWVRVEEHRDRPRSMTEIEKALQLARQWSGYSDSLESWLLDRPKVMQIPRNQPLLPPTKLQLRFWGTRGSIPVSGGSYLRYGGNTSCVSLTSDAGHLFIFDCGSGIRELGNLLMSPEWSGDPTAETGESGNKSINGYIFLSHTHWDHIQGFPFFAPVFQPGNRFHVIGWSNCSQTLSGILAGQMEQIYFPVSLHELPSELAFYSLQFGEVELDGATLEGHLLKHPLPSTAYRLALGGKILVYATDHEPQNIPVVQEGVLLGEDVIDPNLVDMAHKADILIHDAQYSVAELKEKVGWGHNSGVVAVDTAIKAGVKQLVLFHHDPNHNDEQIDRLLEVARQRAAQFKGHELKIVAASDGLGLDL